VPLELREPIVLAPLAGGPSTPALAAAVSAAGGLGFLAAGYKTAEAVEQDIAVLRESTDAPFGVNLFVPGEAAADRGAVTGYVERLAGEAERYGVALGEPRSDDDAFADKLALVARERVPVVSFTFGCPEPDAIAGVKAAGVASAATPRRSTCGPARRIRWPARFRPASSCGGLGRTLARR
jgi:nitronate monooxygenase